MSFFDPKDEIAKRFVSAEFYGFSEPHHWGVLVQSVSACQLLVGAEPIVISRLPGGRPGASVVLYGKLFEWTLTCDLTAEELSLCRAQLDPPCDPEQVFGGYVFAVNNWRIVTCQILNDEGFTGKAFEDFEAEQQRVGRAPWVRRKI
jgi:hypothetical protein